MTTAPLWPKVLLLALGGVLVLLVIARLLARQAVRSAIERERADRALAQAKRDEAERTEKRKHQIDEAEAAKEKAIDSMDAKELEREINGR